ncbi:MAG: hypothetical protein NTZ65_00055 [Candidatus Berkelbacteria bacterium]|nr:hypothetical protein [Candidatus Berkelbacteria bacterium]
MSKTKTKKRRKSGGSSGKIQGKPLARPIERKLFKQIGFRTVPLLLLLSLIPKMPYPGFMRWMAGIVFVVSMVALGADFYSRRRRALGIHCAVGTRPASKPDRTSYPMK